MEIGFWNVHLLTSLVVSLEGPLPAACLTYLCPLAGHPASGSEQATAEAPSWAAIGSGIHHLFNSLGQCAAGGEKLCCWRFENCHSKPCSSQTSFQNKPVCLNSTISQSSIPQSVDELFLSVVLILRGPCASGLLTQLRWWSDGRA